jgi:DNA polymerase-3 subunit epsilon
VSLLSGTRLVAVDTETTGFDPVGGDVVIEVACVTIVNGELGETWSSLVRPARSIPADASKIHHITDAMVAGAPGPAEVAAELRRACGAAPLVFHNAPFDLPFLAALLHAGGFPPLCNPVIDTLGLARGLLSASENSLSALARQLKLPPETAHRAAGDARTTARLLVKLATLWEGKVGSIAELAAASQDVVRRTRRGPDRIGPGALRGERAPEPAPSAR